MTATEEREEIENTNQPLVRYSVTDADIEAAKQRYASLEATTPQGYEAVRAAIRELVSTRTAIEKRRVQLKADALEWGRKVDGEAKRLTAMLLEIEEPLKAKKQAIDDEKERARREKEEAERRAIEEQLRLQREAEEARLKAERDAEEARLKAERERLEAEKARLAEIQQKIERQQAEAKAKAEEEARIEREREEAARRERERVEAERQAEERRRWEAEQKAERERLAKIEAEQKAERERIAAEQAKLEAERRAVAEAKEAERKAREEAERKAAEEARLAAIAPDAEKLKSLALQLRAIAAPAMSTDEGRGVLDSAMKQLCRVADFLESFGSAPEAANG